MTNDHHPAPRPGLVRRINAFAVAPGASRGELAVSYAAAALGALGCLALTFTEHFGPLQGTLLVIVGFDLFGGAVVNATAAGKRRFHADGTPWRRIGFVATHVHPFVLALLFPGFGWLAAAVVYLGMLAGAILIGLAPVALRMPVGFAVAVIATSGFVLLPGIAASLAWFAPLLVIKLLLGHMAD